VALVGALHEGEEARDSRSSSPVACAAVVDHVTQSRAGEGAERREYGECGGRRSHGGLFKPRDVSG
jgi:hypothetical protein